MDHSQHINYMAGALADFHFDKAADYLMGTVPADERMRVLHLLAEEHTGILTYTFICAAIARDNSSFWHRAAALVLLESLNGIANKQSAAYYHASRAMALAPESVVAKEGMLHFYNTGLIEHAHAKFLANAILAKEPNNLLAKTVLTTTTTA